MANILFRAWYYFRNGWSTYFAFIFAAVNTLVVTYFLAIERYPFLKEIFPTFVHYVITMILLGVPILTFVGYIHFKKTAAFQAEAEIGLEVNPFWRRMLINTEIVIPLQLKLTDLMVRLSKNEKITHDEYEEIKKMQKELSEHLNVQQSKRKYNVFEMDHIKKLQNIDKQ
jgi:CBS domain containing-hemolysin-like protein